MLKELEKKFKEVDKWNWDDCQELARLAGMEEELNQADGETFEKVLEKAADKLGIELY